jgi:o-succinylbenzoate---CoA ligase
MLADYPYKDFLMNGRLVELSAVMNNDIEIHSPFESETFRFIQEWFSQKTSFEQFTSGSTGAPKSIQIFREQMIASAALTQKVLGLKKHFTSLLCIDPKFIGGKMMLVRSFTVGMRLICIEPSVNG